MQLKVPKSILSIQPYVPGKPIEALEREYGIRDSIKLASNENPLGPSPLAIAAIRDAMSVLNRYPDGAGHVLVNAIAAFIKVPVENIVLGNGSDDIIGMLTRTFLQPGDEVLLPESSFLMYDICARSASAVPVTVPLKNLTIDLDAMCVSITDRTRMIFLTNPHNPTGSIITQQSFETFLAQIPDDLIIVLDEAYIEFVQDQACLQSLTLLDEQRPLVVLRTFSKLFGLAGLRIGYGIMPHSIAELLNRVRQPFTTNTLAQIGAAAALDDTDFVKQTLDLVHSGLAYLYDALDKMGLTYYPTQANFFLIDVKRPAAEVFEAMLHKGVIVRAMTSYGFPEFIRINVGLPEENQRFIAAMQEVL